MPAARSSALLHRVDSDFQSQLVYNSHPAIFYGVLLFLLGIGGLVLGTLGIVEADALTLKIGGGALTVLGVCLALVRRGLVVDRKLRRVTRQQLLVRPLTAKVYNLTPFDFMCITRSRNAAGTRYQISLSDSSVNFSVATFPAEIEACQFAKEVATFLNVRVVNALDSDRPLTAPQ